MYGGGDQVQIGKGALWRNLQGKGLHKGIKKELLKLKLYVWLCYAIRIVAWSKDQVAITQFILLGEAAYSSQ